MSLKRKRTVAEEKGVFNFKWELDYFMIETEETKLEGELRKICVENLKKSLRQQTS